MKADNVSIVIDPRRTELAKYATHHLALRPGTNVAVLNAMAYTIVEEILYGPRSSEFNEDNYPEVGVHFADTLTLTCAASS